MLKLFYVFQGCGKSKRLHALERKTYSCASAASLSHSHTSTASYHTLSVWFQMHGGLFIIRGVLQLTNKYLEMKSSGQDMFTQTLLRDFMADVSL